MSKRRSRSTTKTVEKKKTVKSKPILTSDLEDVNHGLSEKSLVSLVKVLNTFAKAMSKKSEEVIKDFKTEVNKLSKRDKPGRHAFKSLRNKYKKEKNNPIKTYDGFIVGYSKENDINSMRIKQITAEYKKLSDSKKDDVEISEDEFDELFEEFTENSSKDATNAIKIMSKKLGRRFAITYEKNGYTEVSGFIETMKRWDSGADNFNYGKKLIPDPSVVMYFIDKDSVFYSVNVKGKNIQTLYNAKLNTAVSVNFISQEKKKPYTNKEFNIIDGNPLVVFGTKNKDKIESKILSMTTKSLKVVEVEELNDYFNTLVASDKTQKFNNAILVKGTVSDIYLNTEHNTANVRLIKYEDSEEDFEDFDDYFNETDDDEDEYEDKAITLSVSLSKIMTSKIDFDVESQIYMLCNVYRGNKYDYVNKKVELDKNSKPIPNDMVSANGLGFVFDPKYKVEAEIAPTLTEDDLVGEENEDDESDGFEDEIKDNKSEDDYDNMESEDDESEEEDDYEDDGL